MLPAVKRRYVPAITRITARRKMKIAWIGDSVVTAR